MILMYSNLLSATNAPLLSIPIHYLRTMLHPQSMGHLPLPSTTCVKHDYSITSPSHVGIGRTAWMHHHYHHHHHFTRKTSIRVVILQPWPWAWPHGPMAMSGGNLLPMLVPNGPGQRWYGGPGGFFCLLQQAKGGQVGS